MNQLLILLASVACQPNSDNHQRFSHLYNLFSDTLPSMPLIIQLKHVQLISREFNRDIMWRLCTHQLIICLRQVLQARCPKVIHFCYVMILYGNLSVLQRQFVARSQHIEAHTGHFLRYYNDHIPSHSIAIHLVVSATSRF